jgi:hypothetical protein
LRQRRSCGSSPGQRTPFAHCSLAPACEHHARIVKRR